MKKNLKKLKSAWIVRTIYFLVKFKKNSWTNLFDWKAIKKFRK